MKDHNERLRELAAAGVPTDPVQHAEQVARISAVIQDACSEAGLRSTLVGGSAIEVHAPGIYRSGDIDLVIETVRYDAGPVEEVLTRLGLERYGRHWRMGDWFIEVPSTRLSDPAEWMRVGDAVFHVVTKEVVLVDRVVVQAMAGHRLRSAGHRHAGGIRRRPRHGVATTEAGARRLVRRLPCAARAGRQLCHDHRPRAAGAARPAETEGEATVRAPGAKMETKAPPAEALVDQRTRWPERLARVRGSQARTDVTGMTRPPRDPDERRFLTERGLLGPYLEIGSIPQAATAPDER